jgi:hypothetical protein
MRLLVAKQIQNLSSEDLERWQRGMIIEESSIEPGGLGAWGFGVLPAQQRKVTTHVRSLDDPLAGAYQDPTLRLAFFFD